MSEIKMLKIASIRRDSGAQFRPELNKTQVANLVEAIERGVKLPPIVVFNDGKTNWMGGGDHRIEAHLETGHDEIEAEVTEGTQRDAIFYGTGDNANGLLPRSPKTKRAQVIAMLKDPEWREWPSRQIARHCKVNESFVRQMRNETGYLRSTTQIEVTRNGKSYEMDSAKIGKATEGIALPEHSEHISAKLEKVCEDMVQIGRNLREARTTLTVEQFAAWALAEMNMNREATTALIEVADAADTDITHNDLVTLAAAAYYDHYMQPEIDKYFRGEPSGFGTYAGTPIDMSALQTTGHAD